MSVFTQWLTGLLRTAISLVRASFEYPVTLPHVLLILLSRWRHMWW